MHPTKLLENALSIKQEVGTEKRFYTRETLWISRLAKIPTLLSWLAEIPELRKLLFF